jgi:GWxTD domain-containing protein
MIFRILTSFLLLFSVVAPAQVLRDINYNFRYSPELPFSFQWKVIRQEGQVDLYYRLQLNDTTNSLDPYSLEWETRKSISEKNGIKIETTPETIVTKRWIHTGKLKLNPDPTQQIIVALVVREDEKAKKIGYLFHKPIPQQKSPYLASPEGSMMNPFINKNQSVKIEGFESGKPVHISYYNDPFPAAAPAFSTAQAKVAMTIKPDSTFALNSSSMVSFTQKGLYLAQTDTASSQGLAFRVEEDYPKLGKLESLAGPLIYICTKQEFEKLKLARSDKKKFDQVILSITGNAERARTFMRSYFRRVELANVYFSSYKEGWKSDRGMMYIVFGVPEEVYFFEDREVWEYKNENAKLRFHFVKSPTLFDPENYVLIRDKKFTDTWYQMIDLWRKARF